MAEILELSDWYYTWLVFWTRWHHDMRDEGLDIAGVGDPERRAATAWRTKDENGRYGWRSAAP